MKKHLPTILFILVFLTGLSLLLYPSVSNYWNSLRQSRAISSYAAQVAELNQDAYEEVWAAAKTYNQQLMEQSPLYSALVTNE